MNDPFPRGLPPRFWRQDKGAFAAGVCSGLAEDLDLPLPVVRIVAIVFLILPTGLAYMALALLLRRRQDQRMSWSGLTEGAGDRGRARSEPGRNAPGHPAPGYQGAGYPASGRAAGRTVPSGESWALLHQRFELLEPRLSRIEAFVTAPDFELHRGFRRMGE